MSDEVKSPDPSAKDSSREELLEFRTNQVATILVATVLSLGYGVLTQYFIDGLPRIDWTPLVAQVGAIISTTLIGVGALNVLIRIAKFFLNVKWKLSERADYRIRILAIFALAVQSSLVLGYFTTFTGGTFYSPYVQSLLALALLSPIFAESKETVVFMGFIVLGVFALFGDWDGSGPPEDVKIPALIYFLTPVVALLIALVNTLFGQVRESPLDWQWRWSRRITV